MARLLVAGAEGQDLGFTDPVNSAAVPGAVSSTAVDTTFSRTGTASYKFAGVGGLSLSGVAFNTSTGKYTVRAWVYLDALPTSNIVLARTYAVISSSWASRTEVQLRTDGKIQIGGASTIPVSTTALAPNTWTCIQFQWNFATSAVAAMIGSETISTTGTNGSAFLLGPSNIGTGGATIWMDDIAANDGTGASDNDFTSTGSDDGRVVLLKPVADSTRGADWFLGGGTAPSVGNPAWDNLNRVPPLGNAITAATDTNAIRDAVNNVTNPAASIEFTMEPYTLKAVSGTVRSVQPIATIGDSVNTSGSTFQLGLKVTSNPADGSGTERTTGTDNGSIQFGGWSKAYGNVVSNPAGLTLSSGPKVTIAKRSATASTVYTQFIAALVEYDGPKPASQSLTPGFIASTTTVPSPVLNAARTLRPNLTSTAPTIPSPALSAHALASNFRAAVAADSPTNWWHLDETTGTVAAPAAGAVNGTYVGAPTLGTAALDPAGTGTAVTFDGVNDELTLSTANFTTGSFECLFKWTAGTAIIRDHTNGGGWILLYDNSNVVGMRIGGTDLSPRLATAAVRDGAFHHLVVTWESGGPAALYIDGASIPLGTSTIGAVAAPALPWHVAKNGTAAGFTTGQVDEVAFYNKALSQGRVQEHYRAMWPEPAPPGATTYTNAVAADLPAAWWRLDEADDGRGFNFADAAGMNDAYLKAAGQPTRSLSLLTSEGGGALALTGGQALMLPTWTPGSGSFELWFQWTAGGVIARDHAGGTAGWIFGYDISGTFGIRINNADHSTTKTTAQVRDGNTHHLVIGWTSGEQTKVYLDGVDITVGTATVDTTDTGVLLPINVGFNTGIGGTGSTISVDEIAFYAYVLTATQVNTHYTAGTVTAVAELHPAFWTQPAPTVYGPALTPGQQVAPAALTNPAPTVFEPIVSTNPLWPEFWTQPAPTVFAPTVATGSLLRPARVDATATTYSPTLIRGQFLEPARLDDTATVFDPWLSTNPLWPEPLVNPAPTVFAPELERAEPIYPGPTVNTSTVFAPTIDVGQLVHPALLVSPPATVRAPALERHQVVFPTRIDPRPELPAIVLPPAVQTRVPMLPTFFTATPSVPSPKLQHSAVLQPVRLTDTGSVVRSPSLRPGTLIFPTRTDRVPQVFLPRLIQGSAIRPAFLQKGPDQVYAATLVRGQPIRPGPLTNPATVFPPANLILGQPLRPTRLTKAAATFFDPKLQLGRPLEPTLLTNPGSLVRSPALIPSQRIVVGPLAPGTHTVFPPALAIVIPPIVEADPDVVGSYHGGLRAAK